eukprot:CAMPEP_0181222238 /NCGR_PEP_ID=MMETSP1096-20121128/29853_1 /TAXON_ID=156174 ORGANISM="Chrysochromulina ericina, Strain CCMP281" /NCGR_SAMPLE_ID=MMETSP1096 /ASSEMBLY_ACC=CAM_ASM_000453 /LENGTH=195 /DNA_ID=CAMNT_0023314973 /DNA_START=185 /DNA_END=772 /DNA_ORIENTATION=+
MHNTPRERNHGIGADGAGIDCGWRVVAHRDKRTANENRGTSQKQRQTAQQTAADSIVAETTKPLAQLRNITLHSTQTAQAQAGGRTGRALGSWGVLYREHQKGAAPAQQGAARRGAAWQAWWGSGSLMENKQENSRLFACCTAGVLLCLRLLAVLVRRASDGGCVADITRVLALTMVACAGILCAQPDTPVALSV